nr:MAG TPA_asm: AbrB family transcriptional regulator-like protein [Caudoviricetes sp.]
MSDTKQEQPFRIQITDNRTGKMLEDRNVRCIISGVVSDEMSGRIMISSCKAEVLAKAAAEVIAVLQKLMDEHSDVKTLVPFYMALDKKRNE